MATNVDPTAATTKGTFELMNELIVALSHLLWPVLVFVVIILFKSEISLLLMKIKKGKFLGQEIELNNSEINEFKTVTTEAAETIPVVESVFDISTSNVNEDVLTKANNDPKVGIFLLAIEIEKEITSLIASTGLLSNYRIKSIKLGFELLEKQNFISKSVLHSVSIFWNLRNKIIHGQEIGDDAQILRVLDIGVDLLKTLKLIPHQRLIIKETNIILYKDKEGKIVRPDVVGVIIDRISNTDTQPYPQILATTKRDYEVGVQVSWEWSFNNQWGETWYKNTTTGLIIPAWTESAEFVGRPIKDL